MCFWKKKKLAKKQLKAKADEFNAYLEERLEALDGKKRSVTIKYDMVVLLSDIIDDVRTMMRD